MLLTAEYEFGCPPVIKIVGDLARARATYAICSEIEALRTAGHRNIGVDLSSATGTGFAAAFSLVEIVTREAMSNIAFFAAPESLISTLKATETARFLNIHLNKSDALDSIVDPGVALKGTAAVVLSAGSGTRMGPLSSLAPKPMMDVLGKPVLERLIEHLNGFGISDIMINPGHLGPQIPTYFKKKPRTGLSISYYPEGEWIEDNWVSSAIGSASTLVRMDRHFNALSGDFVVMCGDALTNIDLPAMMTHHKKTNAAVTIAAKLVPNSFVGRYGIIVADEDHRISSFQEKPHPKDARSNLANVGIYIISRSALDVLPNTRGLDIASNLLPALISDGQTLSVYQSDFEWLDMGSGRDYYQVLEKAFSATQWIKPRGRQIHPNVWVGDNVELSKYAKIDGPCYVGSRAKIQRNVRISGPCSIGENSQINANSLIRNSIIMPRTDVGFGTVIDHAIANEKWAMKHQDATHKDAPFRRIDGLSRAKDEPMCGRLDQAS